MKPKTIDDYIALQPLEIRPKLEALRTLIRSAAPKAEETISYGVACFKYKYMLVSFGVTKAGYSFYTMSPALMKAMKKELEGLDVSGVTLHFAPGEKLPSALLKKIVKARVAENEIRASKK